MFHAGGFCGHGSALRNQQSHGAGKLNCCRQDPKAIWIHLAPVFGTANRAREIRRFPSDPKPLHSNEWPEGLPDLSDDDQRRIGIANELFEYACFLFLLASQMGIMATMENPRNSYFWITCWFLQLMLKTDVYVADFQVCMLSGDRDKWTRIVANFFGITVLNIKCDRSHTHLPWFCQSSHGSAGLGDFLKVTIPQENVHRPGQYCFAFCKSERLEAARKLFA